FATVATSDDKPLPSPPGVVIDLRGPPDVPLKLDVYITLEGQKDPTRYPVSCSGWDPTAVKGEIVFWKNAGYVLEKVGETQVRFVGKKDKDGKLIPVVGVKFESKDLRPDQLPTVVPGPKNKA